MILNRTLRKKSISDIEKRRRIDTIWLPNSYHNVLEYVYLKVLTICKKNLGATYH